MKDYNNMLHKSDTSLELLNKARMPLALPLRAIFYT
jgi:hypothetical protein